MGFVTGDGEMDLNISGGAQPPAFSVNSPPVAGDDGPFATTYQTEIVIPRNVMLANDIDPDGGVGNIVSIGNAVGGVATLDANTDNVIFMPAAGFSGNASYSYTMVDGNGALDSATVAITVGATPIAGNTAPTGQDFEFFMDEDTTLVVAGPGVLAGTSDAEGNPLSVILTHDASFGDLFLNPDGSFSFKPFNQYSEDSAFTFRVSDGNLSSDICSAVIHIRGVNDAPIASDDFYQMDLNTSYSGWVLENDGDLEDDRLFGTLVSGVSHGTLVFDDGSFTYTPETGFLGTDSFTYQVSDYGAQGGIATVTLQVGLASDGPDFFTATPDDEDFDGLGGYDTVSYVDATGSVTADLSRAGLQQTGGSGADSFTSIEYLVGSSFADTLSGNDEDNLIDGAAGADRMAGGKGNDRYFVSEAGDFVLERAGEGAVDRVTSTLANYRLATNVEELYLGGSGNINGAGNAADNLIVGNEARNTIKGDLGNDTIEAGGGNDIVDGGLGNDIMDGGEGVDLVTFKASATDHGVDVDLSNPLAQDTGYGFDRIIGFENVEGASFADQLTGDSGSNKIRGLGGDDVIRGGSGADELTGDAGRDMFLFDAAGAANGVDRIMDFFSGVDTLGFREIDGYDINAGFTAGAAAVGSGAQFVWDDAPSSAALYYDADGAGGGAAIRLATFAGATLRASDIKFT
jgi:Ca2+-binding RTX toxin-like protein